MGNWDEPVDPRDVDARLLAELAKGRTMDGERLVGQEVVAEGMSGGCRVDRIAGRARVLRVDTPAGEDMDARRERHRRRALDQQNLGAVLSIPQEDDRGSEPRRDRLGDAHEPERRAATSSSRSAAGSVTGNRQAKSRQT
jgi:hypothetical protein